MRKFIDLDSSFRNRVEYPIPSQFTVLVSGRSGTGSGVTTNKMEFLSPQSQQTRTFPPPAIDPLAFYQDPTGVDILERSYLPFVYSIPLSTTTFLLDELPLAPSGAAPNLTPPTDPELLRNTVPLPEVDNFYISQYLEVVTAGASTTQLRKINGFRYYSASDSDFFKNTDLPKSLQTGRVISYTVGTLTVGAIASTTTVNGVFITLDANPNNGTPPSNIDRFYQGKYVRFEETGERYLILNSFMNDASPILQLEQEISLVPTMSSAISIEADYWWEVSVESPLDDPPAPYPAYQTPAPSGAVQYEKINILNEERIVALKAVRHRDNTIGIAYQIRKKLYYLSSTDTFGRAWNSPVVVSDLSGLTSSFSCGAIHALAVCLIDNNPAIAYTQGGDAQNSVYYARATDSTGTAWNTPVFVEFCHPTRGNIAMQPRPEYDAVAYANPATLSAVFPEILFTNTSSVPKLAYGSGASYDTPAWTIDSAMTMTGYSVDVGLYLNTSVANWNDASKSDAYQSRTVVFIRREADNAPYFYRRTQNNLSWLTNSFSTERMKSYGQLIQIPTAVPATGGLTLSRVVQIPMTIWQSATMDVIYTRTMGLDLSGPPFARVTGEPVISVNVTATAPNITLGEFNGAVADYFQSGLTSSVCYISYDNLVYFNQELFTFQLGVQTVLETGLIDNYAVLTDTNYYQSPWVCFQIYNNSLVCMVPTQTQAQVGKQYRIRDAPALKTGSGYSLTTSLQGGSATTVQFPSSASAQTGAYVGDYVWIYNVNVDELPTPFHMFNDYRQIVRYDGATRTATVFPAFSGDVGTLAVPPMTNLVNWEILQVANDAVCAYDYSGSRVSNQESSCWEVSLVRLILPNILLDSPTGNLTAFYPYVYVKLVNVSAKNRLLLFSNNPNSYSCTFRVPVSFIVSPLQSGFIPLFGVGAQTIKFKPNDCLEFSVLLPDGLPFQGLEPDTEPPFPVNPRLQVSALFSCRKIDGDLAR